MKKIVTLGEVMLRLSTPGFQRFFQANSYDVDFGGTEANVGATLASLGHSVFHLSSFPNNEIGDAAIARLRKNGLRADHIQQIDGRMGTYFLETGSMQRSSKIIYDRADSVFALEACKELDWDSVLDGVDWMHWSGITPSLSQVTADFASEVLNQSSQRGIKVSADLSYRSNSWKYGKEPIEIMPELLSHSHVIIGGLRDFESCLGIKEKELDEAVSKVFEALHSAEFVVTSNRISESASINEFSASLYSRNQKFHSKAYRLSHIVDRVGTGDAFAGALIHGLLTQNEQIALDLGVAGAVMKHSIPGDILQCSEEELVEIINNDNPGRIKR